MVRTMFVYDNCACALTENSNYDPEAFKVIFAPKEKQLKLSFKERI